MAMGKQWQWVSNGSGKQVGMGVLMLDETILPEIPPPCLAALRSLTDGVRYGGNGDLRHTNHCLIG